MISQHGKFRNKVFIYKFKITRQGMKIKFIISIFLLSSILIGSSAHAASVDLSLKNILVKQLRDSVSSVADEQISIPDPIADEMSLVRASSESDLLDLLLKQIAELEMLVRVFTSVPTQSTFFGSESLTLNYTLPFSLTLDFTLPFTFGTCGCVEASEEEMIGMQELYETVSQVDSYVFNEDVSFHVLSIDDSKYFFEKHTSEIKTYIMELTSMLEMFDYLLDESDDDVFFEIKEKDRTFDGIMLKTITLEKSGDEIMGVVIAKKDTLQTSFVVDVIFGEEEDSWYDYIATEEEALTLAYTMLSYVDYNID